MASNPKSSGSGYSAEMDEAERASRDQIAALQTKRLAWTLAHAYDNVAHYKKAFDTAGVHPSDFKQTSDLGKFPFTVKTDLRDNRSEEHTSELQSQSNLVCRLLLEYKQPQRCHQ